MQSIELFYYIILILFAFIPALIYVRWYRNLEKYAREPYGTIISTFLWGAFLAVFFAFVLQYIIYRVLMYEYDLVRIFPTAIVLAVIVAPLTEEFVKPMGIVFRAKKETDEVEDGMIYGACCGLGFAAMENLMYGSTTLTQHGIYDATLLIGVRTFSSTLLHASATAITGYGIGLWLVKKRPFTTVIPYFLFAVLLHAGYNAFAMTNTYFGFIFAVMIAIVATDFVKKKIVELDQRRAQKEVILHLRR